ncbi:MAG: isochorismatase family protein [Proteobacteria bacterium]|nr:isochorismatase family protein [Pseudomonadota bacterium]
MSNFTFPQKDESILIVIDIQDNLLKVFQEEIKERILNRSVAIIKYFRQHRMPILVFEQYPKGIGPTNQRIKDALEEDYKPITKTCFSGSFAEGFKEAIDIIKRKNIILIGIESHICVLQTCYDLLCSGYNVFICADAVGSRYNLDFEIAIKTMENMGATILSTEMLIFRWMGRAGTEEFKCMLPYLK